MTNEKDKFAAVMVNHWYVVRRGLDMGRMKRNPRSKHYASLEKVNELSPDEFRKLASSFTTFTAKNFYSNIQHLINNDPDVAKKEGDEGLKVEFGRATQRRGMPLHVHVADNASNIHAVIKALNFHDQNPIIKELLENLPTFTVVGENSGQFTVNIPSAKRRVFQSFMALEDEVMKQFNTLKSFLKLYQLIATSLTEENKSEIVAERAVIKLVSPRFRDGNVEVGSVQVEETEQARNERILRQKLEEKLRRRTQNTTHLELDTDQRTVTYHFEGQEHRSITLNLDVITSW